MNLQEAKQVCEGWLSHLEVLKARRAKMSELSRSVNTLLITQREANDELRRLFGPPKVYDGTRLADAVRVILKQM